MWRHPGLNPSRSALCRGKQCRMCHAHSSYLGRALIRSAISTVVNIGVVERYWVAGAVPFFQLSLEYACFKIRCSIGRFFWLSAYLTEPMFTQHSQIRGEQLRSETQGTQLNISLETRRQDYTYKSEAVREKSTQSLFTIQKTNM